MGLVLLLGLLLALIIVRTTMQYWIKPEPLPEHKELVAAWENFKKQQIKHPVLITEEPKPDEPERESNYRRPAKPKFTGPVNINTADSLRLVTLKGIGPKLAQKIIKRRQEKGPFTSYEQLLEIRKFPDEIFETLKKQIIIK